MTQFESLVQMLFKDIDFPCFSILMCWAAKHCLVSAERFLHVLLREEPIGTSTISLSVIKLFIGTSLLHTHFHNSFKTVQLSGHTRLAEF